MFVEPLLEGLAPVVMLREWIDAKPMMSPTICEQRTLMVSRSTSSLRSPLKEVNMTRSLRVVPLTVTRNLGSHRESMSSTVTVSMILALH